MSMGEAGWRVVATVSDTISALALRTFLEAEGITAVIQADTSLLGEARPCDILVPEAAWRRARRLLAESQFSDAELSLLATGRLDDTTTGDA
jgi:hypothetical protein